MSKLVKIILVIFCLFGVYVFLLTLSPKKTRNGANTTPVLKALKINEPSKNLEQPTSTAAPTTLGEIEFTGKSFNPPVINIKSGARLNIINNSNVNMWPASNNHPSHTLYPEFDALKPILPGESYSVILTKMGTWGYHDHLQPKITGQVVVSP